MHFARTLLAGASLLSLALAQAKIAFTSVPAVVQAGDSYNITWGGGNGQPVTLTLRKGDPNDLETVDILADGVEGNSYEWKVDTDLDSGTDYALQITQGQSDINYSGQFSLSGGKGSVSVPYTASSTSTTSANSSSTTTGSASQTTNGTMSSNSTANSTEMSSTTTAESSTTTEETSTTSSTRQSRTSAASATAAQTSAPNSQAAAIQFGSSAAFALAVLGAVMFLN